MKVKQSRESVADMLARVREMASPDGVATWDLSENDRAALRFVLESRADLLAAMKAIVEHEQIDGTGIRYVFDWHSPFGQQARAALAKAEGRDR